MPFVRNTFLLLNMSYPLWPLILFHLFPMRKITTFSVASSHGNACLYSATSARKARKSLLQNVLTPVLATCFFRPVKNR